MSKSRGPLRPSALRRVSRPSDTLLRAVTWFSSALASCTCAWVTSNFGASPTPKRPWARSRCFWLSATRSEEHTSELQSLAYLVCRLLLEKKKKMKCCTNQRVDSYSLCEYSV